MQAPLQPLTVEVLRANCKTKNLNNCKTDPQSDFTHPPDKPGDSRQASVFQWLMFESRLKHNLNKAVFITSSDVPSLLVEVNVFVLNIKNIPKPSMNTRYAVCAVRMCRDTFILLSELYLTAVVDGEQEYVKSILLPGPMRAECQTSSSDSRDSLRT